MNEYCFQIIDNKGTNNDFEVDGEIVETYTDKPYNTRFVALVKRGKSSGVQESEDVSETVEKITCATDNTDCSRTVENEGETCWQHGDSN